MSITRSYNKHTDTYYAYDTTYEWSEKLQKKVQRKKCIGKYDPETGTVIPNGRRGRPARQTMPPEHEQNVVAQDARETHEAGAAEALAVAESIHARIESIESTISEATRELEDLRNAACTLIRLLRDEV